MSPIIIQKARLKCDSLTAFTLFTDHKHLVQWLCKKANVIPEAGGPFELFWRPENPEIDSTIGCKILAIEKPYYLNFEWKGPERFRHFMNASQPLTNVSLIFHELGDETLVTLIHTGWRNYGEWHEAVSYFTAAWKGAFEKLEVYSQVAGH